MGGAVLQKPAESAAGVEKQEPGEVQQQQVAAVAVKQEPGVEQQQQQQQQGMELQRQRPQQPVMEVKMLGRLYDPAEIDRKLFEDLDDLDSSEEEFEEDDSLLLLPAPQQQGLGGEGDLEAEDDAAAAVKAASKQHQQQGEADGSDGEAEGASGGDQSSGSWWQDELDGMEDAFGFYTFAVADADSDDEGALEGSDDDFRPRRSGCRKRRRHGGAAGVGDGVGMRGGKRMAMAVAGVPEAAAVAAVAVDAAA
jgi:hypothetical protein